MQHAAAAVTEEMTDSPAWGKADEICRVVMPHLDDSYGSRYVKKLEAFGVMTEIGALKKRYDYCSPRRGEKNQKPGGSEMAKLAG